MSINVEHDTKETLIKKVHELNVSNETLLAIADQHNALVNNLLKKVKYQQDQIIVLSKLIDTLE